ncbi:MULTISPECIES: response regulator transcription factor [Actinoalloteichus]|uniref:LuxR family transcriptional regulator n=1 Tax=Actinoalloteichus fjordicus TaxID=1612552 RepID=A0AAC9PRW7_9PSEU|nr:MULTISPECIES: response regulator transcription factor [Actinoalloteichus]APU14869.1 LuxR family transcriptional regulator [Actinoalloteichus fjordicus]APU20838.1 LuxR family transcriptional regulator [Actinoalloteichus sp. GBA129-24]
MRVVIAEDSVLLRTGLLRLLRDEGIDVVADVGDADALLRSVEDLRPELCLVDVRMPPGFSEEGIHAAVEIRRRHPDIAVVVLSQYVVGRYAAELITGGATRVGYLLKDRVVDLDDFLAALRRVVAGGTAFDQEVIAQLLTRNRDDARLGRLSPRELEVLGLMAQGLNNAGIAERLMITERAIEKHINGIFTRLDLGHQDHEHRRVRAVLEYLRNHGVPEG